MVTVRRRAHPYLGTMLRIRLITFDALHTIITPRHPIHVQYSQVFAPFLGVLPPESIKKSFIKGEHETPG